jgi:hypothetical protein
LEKNFLHLEKKFANCYLLSLFISMSQISQACGRAGFAFCKDITCNRLRRILRKVEKRGSSGGPKKFPHGLKKPTEKRLYQWISSIGGGKTFRLRP